jgi:hypothetical protein
MTDIRLELKMRDTSSGDEDHQRKMPSNYIRQERGRPGQELIEPKVVHLFAL